MPGEKLSQVPGHTNGPHTRSAATVRDAKGLVQVHVTHICPHVARATEPNLSIQVRSVHIHLTAVSMDNFANLTDAFFKYTMSGGISNHDRCKSVVLFIRFRAKICQVDV